MKKFLVVATALSGLLAFVDSASAADPVVESAQAYDWTGPYVGIVGGYGWGDFESSSTPATHELTDFDNPLDDANGITLGGTLGFNYQVNNIVWGLEADVSWSDINDDFVDPEPEWHADLDWMATIRPRVGLAFDRVLPYITGGLAIGGIELDAFDNFGPPGPSTNDSNTHFGWTIGGGVEFAATDSISIKGEYNYVDFGNEEYDLTSSPFFGEENMDLQIHMVKLGVNWNF